MHDCGLINFHDVMSVDLKISESSSDCGLINFHDVMSVDLKIIMDQRAYNRQSGSTS